MAFAVFATVFSTAAFSVEPEKKPYKIFILHSYEQGHVCGQPQHEGILAALDELGFNNNDGLDVRTFYMDTKRKNNSPELIEQQAKIALKQIRLFEPKVLVTLDDNAFSSVALKLVDSGIPIVFCGLNGQPETYNEAVPFMVSRSAPGGAITGVYEKLHLADALRVHSKIFPDLKKVMMLSGPSPTGKALMIQIKIELGAETVPCMWELKEIGTWEEYQEQIFAINADPMVGAIYPGALLLKDKNLKTYTAPEILSWTIKNCTKPGIAINYAFTHLGLFGGAAVDFYAMGGQAGAMAARIFMGDHPSEIPIEDAEKFALVFNVDRAQSLGLTIPSDILLAADDVVQSSP